MRIERFQKKNMLTAEENGVNQSLQEFTQEEATSASKHAEPQNTEVVPDQQSQDMPSAFGAVSEEPVRLHELLSLGIFAILLMFVLYIVTIRLLVPPLHHALVFAIEAVDNLQPKRPGRVELVRVITKPAIIGYMVSVEYEFYGERADAVLFYLNDSIYTIHYFPRCRIPHTVAPNPAGVRHRMIFSFMALTQHTRLQAELVAAEHCGDSARWETISRSVLATIRAFSVDEWTQATREMSDEKVSDQKSNKPQIVMSVRQR